MKATPPARALSRALEFLDRYWGPLGCFVIVVFEAVVFAPRGMTGWMIGGAILGAGLLLGWLAGA